MHDLTVWDEEYDRDGPKEGFTGMMRELKDLDDGEYEFEITSAQTKQPKGNFICECGVKVMSPGAFCGEVFQWSHFLNDADGAKFFAGNVLKKLGFDVDNWKKAKGRPFSQEFTKSLRLLPGLHFRGRKSKGGPKSSKPGEFFQNVYVGARAEDGRPKQFGAAELDAAAPAPHEHDPFADVF